jgi:hypothetical protein
MSRSTGDRATLPPMARSTAPRALALASGLSAVLMVIAGTLGGLVVQLLGGPLAMGMAIWSGRTTEPVDPGGSYPWLGWGVGVALTAWGLWAGLKAEGTAKTVGPIVATVASAALALLPIIWLVVLRGRT